MKKYYCLYLIVSLLTCERLTEVDFEIPFSGEKITVYGFLTDQDSSKIEIYQNQAVLEEFPEFEIELAKVTILENSLEKLELDLIDQSSLNFLYPFEIENQYSIEINHNTETFVSEKVIIPSAIKIDSITTIIDEAREELFLSLYFTDTPEAAYYSVGITEFVGDKPKGKVNIIPNYRFCFDDSEFKNQSKKYDFSRINYFSISNGQPSSTDSLEISLYVVSEEFYNFSESVRLNNQSLSSAADPNLGLYSNIEGTSGFVCGFSKTRIGYKFP